MRRERGVMKDDGRPYLYLALLGLLAIAGILAALR